MLKIKFLPGTIGDAIWVSYGKSENPKFILIDGGTAGTRKHIKACLLYTSPSPRDQRGSRMPSSA